MKFIIREDKLHRLIFKFLDNQNFVEIQKKQDEICFVNKDGINFIQILYNKNNKKDYYFIVMNKTDASDIIVNSVKGLSVLTPNINNLPFFGILKKCFYICNSSLQLELKHLR